MATPKKKPLSRATKKASDAEKLAEAERTIAALKAAVDQQATAAAIMQSRTADRTPGAQGGDLMVGLRNVSSLTIGIRSKNPSVEPDIHLHADHGDDSPSSVTMISYAWWRLLLRDEEVKQGLIMRDDSVLGGSFRAAPADDPRSVPAEHYVNLVVDPVEWLESRTPEEITEDVDKMTSAHSLRRLMSAIDNELRRLENQYPRETPEQQVVAAKKALNQLNSKFRHADSVIRMKLDEQVKEIPRNTKISY